MELQKYMRGGLDVSEAEVDSLWTPYAVAQRALDAEREKVKELEQEGLQLFEWRLALHSLTPGGSEFCTPEACESWVRKSRASQHEYIIEQIKQRKELQAQLATLQAQLRQVEGERDEAIECASRPTWVCDGCGRVSQDGWVDRVIELMDGTEYCMECPVCGVRDIEEDCASDLARERDDLQDALAAQIEEGERMIQFETRNSIYRVSVNQEGMFVVVKTEEKSESPYNAVGVPRISPVMRLCVGERALFDSWSTSPVEKISPITPEAPHA